MIGDIVLFGKFLTGIGVSINDVDKLMKKASGIASREPETAIKYYDKVIKNLEKRKSTDSKINAALGLAYYESGYIDMVKNRKDAAADKLYKAKKLNNPLNKVTAIFLAEHYAAKETRDDDIIISVYLDYLTHVPSPTDDNKGVYAILESICAVKEDATPNKKEFDRLIALNLKALKANSQLEWPQYYIGLACYKMGDYKGAIGRLERSVTINPGRAKGYYYIGKIDVHNGNTDDALDAFRVFLKSEPENVDASFQAGKIIVDKGRPSVEAIRLLEKAVKSDGTKAEYHYYLGEACFLNKDIAGAVTAFAGAVGIDGSNKDYHYSLAKARHLTGDIKGAYQSAKATILHDMWHVGARTLCTELCISLRLWPEAEEHARIVLTKGFNETVFAQLMRALYHQNKHGEAALEYDKASWLKAGESKAPEILDMNKTFAMDGSTEALDINKTMAFTTVTGRPSYATGAASVEALYYIARSLIKLGRAAEAVDILAHLAGHMPEARFYYYQGLALCAAGKYEESIGVFRRAAATGSDFATCAYLQGGNALYEIGRVDEARESLIRARTLNPEDAAVRYALGRLYYGTGDYENALKELSYATDLNPGEQIYHYAKGMALERLGKPEDAAIEYKESLKSTYYGPSMIRMGIVLSGIGRYKDAYAALNEAIEKGDTQDDALFYAGYAAVNNGDFSRGREIWEKLRVKKPDDRKLLRNIHRTHYIEASKKFEEKDYMGAINGLKEYLSVYSNDEDAKAILAESYFRLAAQVLKTPGSSLDEAEKLLRLSADNSPERDVYQYYLSLIMLKKGDYASGESILTGLSAKEPSSVSYRYHLGVAKLMKGDAGGQKILEGIDDGVYGVYARQLLADRLIRQKRWGEAERYLAGIFDGRHDAALKEAF